MTRFVRFREQIQRNSVALISLAVAVSSLAYNTWRNEASEHNRNQRLISIEILRNIGELQQVVYHRHWEMDDAGKGSPLTGWALVLTIKDLTEVLDDPVPASGTELWAVWDENFRELGEDRSETPEYKAIIAALETVRQDTHSLLKSLD